MLQNEIGTRIAQSKFAKISNRLTILFQISVKTGILFISEFRLGRISVYFRFHYRQESCLVQSSV